MEFRTIGVVGNGYVGGATSFLGNHLAVNPAKEVKMFLYDINPDLCSHDDITLQTLSEVCDFIFVCVPTPMEPDGSCSTYEVSKTVIKLADFGFSKERIIVRSTVSVGTCRDLGVMYMPEFLTEKRWKEDFFNQKRWILGTNDRNDKIRDELYEIFRQAHENGALLNPPEINFMTTEEAELIKYVRNGFLATKVSFFNEIYDFCKSLNIDYEQVRKGVVMDDRIGESHSQVPGPDGKRGFGGTCFPKDMMALEEQLSKFTPLEDHLSVIKTCNKRNNKLDRPEKDWKKNKGRTVL
tara:strand:- start:1234 stop:2118 length:885 start_codon:yes stop_codon:yes gene_type:complete